MEKSAKVYEAINRVSDALSKVGISKDRKTQGSGQTFSFRGIDDVYRALAPLLSENKLCMLPEVLDRSLVERTSKSGGMLFYVTVKMKFRFVSAEDGSSHEVVTYGEAMDSSDKATNKAMSAAYKYAAFLSFCIPTEGDNDTENNNHEVIPRPKITIDQAVEIDTKITSVGADKEKFLKFMCVKDVREIPADHYKNALYALDAKSAKQQVQPSA